MNITIKAEDPKFKIGDYIKFANRCIVEVYDYNIEYFSNFSLRKDKCVSRTCESSYVLVVQESYCNHLKPSDILMFSSLKVDNEGEKVNYIGQKFQPKSLCKGDLI